MGDKLPMPYPRGYYGTYWRKDKPELCLYECCQCGETEVWRWGDRYCPECSPPALMVFRRYATENDCATDK